MLIPVRGWLLICTILGISFSGYYHIIQGFSLSDSEDDQVRVQMAERWAQQVASKVKRLSGRPLVAVAPVVNDKDAILTKQLRTWIARRNVRMDERQWPQSVGYQLGLLSEPASIEQAVEPFLDQDFDFIIAARINNWTTYPEFEARLLGIVEIFEGKTGEKVSEYRVSLPEMIEVVNLPPQSPVESETKLSQKVVPVALTASSARGKTGSESQPHRASPLSGMTIWLASVVLIPMMSSAQLKRLLRRKSNQINTWLIACWVIAISLLAIVLWILYLPLSLGIPSGLTAVVLATFYFAYCCHWLEKAL